MTVSVVIPTYNSEKTISETIMSVLGQTKPASEIIVVNDGSTDYTRKIAEDFQESYPQIKILDKEDPEHRGVGPVRNVGFRVAQGEYFLPLDADDLIEPEYIEKTTALIQTDSKIGVVCTDMQYFGIWNNYIRSWSINTGELRRDMTFEDECNANNIPCCSLIRREAYEQVGGYNEYLFGHEDWSLWISILHAGWKVQCIHEPLFRYRTRRGGYAEWMNRNRGEIDSLMREIHGDIFTGSRIEGKIY